MNKREPWLLTPQEVGDLGGEYLRSHPVPYPQEQDDILLRAQHRKSLRYIAARMAAVPWGKRLSTMEQIIMEEETPE